MAPVKATARPTQGIEVALPEYQIVQELGRGSMGLVYLGRHRKLGRDVAIKELPQPLAADPGVRSRFSEEARTLGQLNHPHIVTVYDFIDRDGRLALVMEKLGGGTVWDRFVNQGVSTATACGLVLSAAAGLDHAHKHGVLHRDVKPENLMFTDDGQLKVTDFGIAKAIAGDRTMATPDGNILGTPAYMSPEQAEGLPVGPAADVYACGTILYEMLCGQLPFAHAQTPMALLLARVRAEAPPIEVFNPSVPTPIARVTNKAIARSIEHRYQSVQQFAVALGHAAASTWGLEWLSGCGVAVNGSEPIERAARTTSGGSPIIDITDSSEHGSTQPKAAAQLSGIRTSATNTIPDNPIPHPSLEGFADNPVLSNQPHYQTSNPGADPYQHLRSFQSGPQPPRSATPARTITPSQIRSQRSVDLSHISATELVDIGEIQQQPKAIPLWLISALFTIVSVAWVVINTTDTVTQVHPLTASATTTQSALSINGYTLAEPDTTVPLNLSRHMTVAGLEGSDHVNLATSVLGITIGSTNGHVRDGTATLAPGSLQWTVAGTTELTLTSSSQGTQNRRIIFKTMTSHRWWTTVPILVISVLGLASGSWFLFSLIKLRQAGFKLGWLLAATGATATVGAALAATASITQNLEISKLFVVTTAIATGLAGTSFAEGYRCRYRHQRVRRCFDS